MLERRRILLGRCLMALGVMLALVWVAVAIDAHWFQSRAANRLREVAREQRGGRLEVASATRHEASTTGLIGRIEIPRIRYSAYVHEGVNGRALRRGVGHLPKSAFPGEAGNVALAGHRDTWFKSLRKIEPGDRITLATPDGRFSYEVEKILVVKPSRSDLVRPSHRAKLTLVTCYPFHWIGPAPQRFVVVARAAENPAPSASRGNRAARSRG